MEPSQTLAPIHLIQRRADPLGHGRGGPSWGMHHLSEYSSFEVVFFFRLADKHSHNIDLVSAILRSHPLVTEEKGYNAERLTPPALLNLVRQLLEEDSRIQAQANGGAQSATARLLNFSGPPPQDEKLAEAVIERVWLRAWKRLSDDLVKSVKECDEKANNVRKQIDEIKNIDAEPNRAAAAIARPPSGFPPRNGALASAQFPYDAAKAPPRPSVSPLAAPGPEVVKKGPTPVPQVHAAKREIAPQPQRAPQQLHPQPLRPIQPIAAAPKFSDPARQNGAGPVLQAPPGVSQSLSPVPQPGRPASTGTTAPRAPPDAAAKPKQSAGSTPQTPVPPPLKWEAPYQGPHPSAQRPLQPTPARVVSTPPLQAGQATKWPSSPLPSQPSIPAHSTTAIPAQMAAATPGVQQAQQPRLPSTPGVLAPPQPAGQLARPQPRPVPGATASTPSQAQQQARPSLPTQIAPTPAAQPSPRPPTTPATEQKKEPVQQQPLQKPPTPAVSTPVAKTPVPIPIPGSQPSQKPIQVPVPVKFPPTLQIPPPAQPQALQAKPAVVAKPAAPQPTTRPAPATPQAATDQTLLRNTAIATLQKRLSGIRSASLSAPQSPQTPQALTPSFPQTGHSTKWVADSTPSTPGPLEVTTGDLPSPAYEHITSPIRKPATLPPSTPQPAARLKQKSDASVTKSRGGRASRTSQATRGRGVTPLGPTRRSQSVVSQVDELSMDHSDFVGKVKDESTTPRVLVSEETGDTTADESAPSRRGAATPSGFSRRSQKRKRQDSEAAVTGPPTHVQWSRGFPKVSASALDQIGSHRDANMFANPIRERDAPNYSGIVLQPVNIMSIKKAITHGNRVATQVAANLPGGDPGSPVVLLPISEDLVPPKGIINSAQLERELVHMFCNAIMYNPDPDRGPGRAFMRGGDGQGGDGSLRYQVDEFGVVRNTRNMFVEVEKLLTDLRNAESQRGLPAASLLVQNGAAAGGGQTTAASATGDDSVDDVDELAQDDGANTGRRKRAKA